MIVNAQPKGFGAMGASGGTVGDRRDGPAETCRILLASAPPLRLGDLQIEPNLRRVAHADGREEILEPRVMQVLVALVRAGGRILTRDELLASCWHGVVVGEDAIERVMARVRRLGEGLGGFRLETIPKVGYRLVLPAHPTQTAPPSSAAPKVSICVLPFANMSDDPQQAYFSDGMTEDIITDLSRISSLFVVARTTAFSLRDKSLDVPGIARRLNVSHVLEGSVRKAQHRVRVTAQLVDGATGGHLWAERYDRDLDDIFALQDEISGAVVRALRLQLLPEEQRAIQQRDTTSPQAYNLYLMARRYYVTGQQGDTRGLEAIVRLCRRATELDPAYARAWALMGFAQAALQDHGVAGDGGLAAVERALSLDARLADAHALNASQLWELGREQEAIAEIDVALSIDPASWIANSVAGRLNYKMRRFHEAIRYWETATASQEAASSDPGMLMSTYAAVGDAEGIKRAARVALDRAERALAREDINGAAMCCGVSALAALGEEERARDLMERGLLLDPDNMMMRYNFACGIVTYLKDVDTALELLAPVFATASASWLKHALIDPDLDHIRDDPRLQAMLRAAEARLSAAAEAAEAHPVG
jgi:adenylate cyclase